VSTALIRFNKHMMQEDRFPFSLALSTIHMIFATILCIALRHQAIHVPFHGKGLG
jgi:hypothetical protein